METKNQVVQLSGGLALQNKLLTELDTANKEFGKNFSDYGKQCVINAISSLVMYCSTNDIAVSDLNGTQVRLALQNIGFTELNTAALPSECYIETRKVWLDNKQTYSVAIRPQGAGNEKLVRKYGVGVKTLHDAFIIREGDEYTLPGFDGEKITPFKWTRKSLDAKPIMVVYRLIKTDDSIEYLIATRESVKANIVAHIRQNTLYEFKKVGPDGKPIKENNKFVIDEEYRDQFYQKLNEYAESHTVDELLSDPTFKQYINPTYVSFGSKEQMILRKMKNNALKNYPREFSDSYTKAAVENMFEDVDESLNQNRVVEIESDPVEKVENEINEEQKGDAVPDFDANNVESRPEEEPQSPKEPEDAGSKYGI